VHIGANFVNPGWRGHMPLQLVNHGNTSIRLFPYIPICQLLLVKLTQEPERVYGEKELQSKYMDDDGGPSYWWRDKRIGRLQAKQAFTNLSLRVQEQVLKTIGAEDPDVVEEFDEFISKQSVGSLESARTVLEVARKIQTKKSSRKTSKWCNLSNIGWHFARDTLCFSTDLPTLCSLGNNRGIFLALSPGIEVWPQRLF
jgi:hypothetical protein